MSVKHIVDFILTPTGILYQTENIYKGYIGAQNGSYPSDDPQRKSLEAQPLSSTGQVEKVLKVNCEIVNSDRQFCGTVHVIS